jgi:hypothetical protein
MALVHLVALGFLKCLKYHQDLVRLVFRLFHSCLQDLVLLKFHSCLQDLVRLMFRSYQHRLVVLEALEALEALVDLAHLKFLLSRLNLKFHVYLNCHLYQKDLDFLVVQSVLVDPYCLVVQ